MKNFISKIFLFFAIGGVVFIIGILLPTTPKAKNHVLFSKIQKDSLLQNVPSPRIVFIGGSNLVYGLNSQLLKDSLDLNSINTGSIATIGLSYMMDNTLPFIRNGDIVVISPEYQQFFGSFSYGNLGLLRLLMDVDSYGFKYLRTPQWINITKKLPEYFVSKFDPNEYFNVKINPAYGVNIFNEYGDSNAHWVLKKQGFDPDDFKKRELNKAILADMKIFQNELLNKGAHLFVTYPCFQAKSFDLNRAEIDLVENALVKNDFDLLGTAERYKMNDSLMFDTPYHLIKIGVDHRTELLIVDIKNSGILN